MLIKAYVLFVLLAVSCGTTSKTQQQPKEAEKQAIDYAASKYSKATVIDYTELDGCKYLFQLEDGRKLNPGTIDAKYQKNGLKVWLKYERVDLMNVCMAGETIKVIDIAERSE